MSHAHSHDHSHHMPAFSPGDNTRPFIIGITLNILFVIAEVIAGFINNSMSLLTDAGHNLSDVASLVLSLIAFSLAKKRSTAKFTYGYKKTTVLAALLNAVLLLIAIGILGYESVKRLIHPQEVDGNVIAWVAGLGILINAITAMLFFKKRKSDLNIKSAYLHMLSDTLVSVGVVAGGIVIYYTGWNWVDPVIGIIIMLIILFGTWSLLTDSFKLSVDAVPTGIDLHKVRELMISQPGVADAHHIHIWAMSTFENALTAHINVERNLTFENQMEIVKKLKHTLQHHSIQHSTIEIENELSAGEEKVC